MKSRAEIFKELTEKAADIYRRKNADYGDSFVKVRNKKIEATREQRNNSK